MRTKLIKLGFLLLTGLFSESLSAQTDKDKNLGNNQVDVDKEYVPTILDAQKIFETPLFADSIPPAPKLTYPIPVKQFPTQFKVEPIAHATIKGEPLVKLQNHLLKAGFGNYNTPYFDYYYSSGRAKKYNYGINAGHFSSGGSLKNTLNTQLSDNYVKAFGKVFMKDHLLSGDANYIRNAFHYYGITDSLYSDSLSKQLKSYAQWFGNIEGNGRIQSLYADSSKINYDAKIKYYSYFDNYNALETNVNLSGDIGRFVNTEWIGGTAGFDYYYNTNSVIPKSNAYILNLSPRAELKRSALKVRVGVKAYVQADSANSYFHFYPDIDARFTVVEKYIHLYGGITGKVVRNSYKSITQENPFVIPTATLKNSSEKINTYGGVFGALSNKLNYSAGFEYREVNNFLLYQNYSANLLQNKFITLYDTAKILRFTGELNYQISEKFRLLSKVNYTSYKLNSELKPWNLPQLEMNLSARYNLKDKIIVGADLFYIGARSANGIVADSASAGGYKTKPIALKPFTDASLFMEYRYTKSISAFIRLNNIASQRYYRWNNYPSYRFNFLLGFTYSF